MLPASRMGRVRRGEGAYRDRVPRNGEASYVSVHTESGVRLATWGILNHRLLSMGRAVSASADAAAESTRSGPPRPRDFG